MFNEVCIIHFYNFNYTKKVLRFVFITHLIRSQNISHYLEIHLREGDVARVEVHHRHAGVVDVDEVEVERLHHVALLADSEAAVLGEEGEVLPVARAPDDGVHRQPVLWSPHKPDPTS